jgi:hypothetical protein
VFVFPKEAAAISYWDKHYYTSINVYEITQVKLFTVSFNIFDIQMTAFRGAHMDFPENRNSGCGIY